MLCECSWWKRNYLVVLFRVLPQQKNYTQSDIWPEITIKWTELKGIKQIISNKDMADLMRQKVVKTTFGSSNVSSCLFFFSCFPLELSKVGHEILITITIRFFIFSMCLSSLETVLLLGGCVLFCCCFDMMNSLTIDLMCSRRHSVVTSGTNARRRRGKLWKIEIRWKKLLKKMWKDKISDNFFSLLIVSSSDLWFRTLTETKITI